MDQTNQEIAASIIGHIRRAAPGEAMEAINSHHAWTPAQRKWLDRLARQAKKEVLIDNDFVNRVLYLQLFSCSFLFLQLNSCKM